MLFSHLVLLQLDILVNYMYNLAGFPKIFS